MCSLRLGVYVVSLNAVLLFAVRAQAQDEAPAPEPSKFLGRVGASIGGGYTTNLYLNASGLDDTLGLAKLSFDGNWLPTSDLTLKLSYLGDGEINRSVTSEGHWGHSGNLTLGYRLLDELFTSLAGGAEQSYYPSNRGSRYSFWGAFGRAGVRYEAGESTTLKLDYRFRQDQFPKYDLDNRTHLAVAQWDQAIGDYVELRVPVTFESTYYTERFLAASDGSLTAEHRTGTRWQAEPTVVIMPSFGLRITGSVIGEKNSSNDTYYYPGPFGVTEPGVNPSLIAHYDSYLRGSTTWSVRWDIADPLTATVHVSAGLRQFDKRPAYDSNGLATGEKEKDTWLEPGVEARWRITDFVGLSVNYTYLKQWSNDALWDFDAHRVEGFVDVWWGN